MGSNPTPATTSTPPVHHPATGPCCVGCPTRWLAKSPRISRHGRPKRRRLCPPTTGLRWRSRLDARRKGGHSPAVRRIVGPDHTTASYTASLRSRGASGGDGIAAGKAGREGATGYRGPISLRGTLCGPTKFSCIWRASEVVSPPTKRGGGSSAMVRTACQRPKVAGPLRRFLAQFENLLIYVLIAAAAVTAALGHWVDTGVILAVVLVNAVLGFLQEGKAERALDAIREMLSPQAIVIRDRRRRMVPAEELVPGDIVFLQSGDKVPADLRLVQVKSLQVQEAVLTGESVAVEKDDRTGRPGGAAGRSLLAWRTPARWSATARASAWWSRPERTPRSAASAAWSAAVERLTTPLLRQMARFAPLADRGHPRRRGADLRLRRCWSATTPRARCSWPPSASRSRRSPRACRRS